VAYYRKQNMLRTVNGMAPIADVTAAIDKALPSESPALKPKPARNGAKRVTAKLRKPKVAVRLGKKSSKRASSPRKTAAAHKSPARKPKSGETARP
jgi:hypothetical protein